MRNLYFVNFETYYHSIELTSILKEFIENSFARSRDKRRIYYKFETIAVVLTKNMSRNERCIRFVIFCKLLSSSLRTWYIYIKILKFEINNRSSSSMIKTTNLEFELFDVENSNSSLIIFFCFFLLSFFSFDIHDRKRKKKNFRQCRL